MRALRNRTLVAVVGAGALAAATSGAVAAVTAPAANAAPVTSAPTAGKTGTFTGATSTLNKYTPTTVTIKVVRGKVTNVSVRVTPKDPATVAINKGAIPRLTKDAVKKQSAKKVSNVSGASLTTKAFKQSLQSALSKAGLRG